MGRLLRKDESTGQPKIPDATVPGKVFSPGPIGYHLAEAYAKVAGKPFMDPFLDAAAESLRKDAMRDDGTLDPAKFAQWQAKHAEALRALPAHVRSQFADAASATRAFDQAAADRKNAIDAFQKGSAAKLLGITDPEDVTKTVGAALGARDGVRQMRALAQQAAKDPNAKEGLRKAIADNVLRAAMSNTEAGTTGVEKIKANTFQNFLRSRADAMKAGGITDAELVGMEAIGHDIQRAQRTLNATRLEGQSNTAQDAMARIRKFAAAHPHLSTLGKLIVAKEGLEMGHHLYGWPGAIAFGGAFLGQHVASAMRAAGASKVQDLVRDALLNPELAQRLLARASQLPNRGSEIALTKLLARNALFSGLAGQRAAAQPQVQ
jgi:hypothetical protein